MRYTQIQVFNAVRRVQNFLDANDALLGDVNKSATRAELNDISTKLDAHAGAQAAGKINAKGETSNGRALRLALRAGHMNPIAVIARSKLRNVPQFSSLVMPPSNASARATVVHAGAMAQAAEQYAQVFVDAGLSSDFVAKLEAAAAAVQASIEVRSTSLGLRTGATGALATAESRARSIIQVLDSVVVPALTAKGGQSALLAEWKSIRRVTSKLGPVSGTMQAARAAGLAGEHVSAPPASGLGEPTAVPSRIAQSPAA